MLEDPKPLIVNTNLYHVLFCLFSQLDRKKKEGTYKTKKQKEQEARAEAAKAAMLAAGLEGELVTEWGRGERGEERR